MKKNVAIIGAGPAGSSAAKILSSNGISVTVFEKSIFPRYSIGESLIPYCYFPLKRLGLLEQLGKSTFVKKYSVQFARPDGKISQPFYFDTHCKGPEGQTWQVERSIFDEILYKNAMKSGTNFVFDCEIKDLIFANDRAVGLVHKNGNKEYFDFIIDATGRQTFASRILKWKIFDPNLKKMAIWNYFKSAKRDEGKNEGATTVASIDDNSWFWYIPLQNDVVSIGLVGDQIDLFKNSKDSKQIFESYIEKNKWVKAHIGNSLTTGAYQMTGEFTYRAKHSSMKGLALIGDSFSFLDPVFSSGVYLALTSGVMIADVLVDIFSGKNELEMLSKYSNEIIGQIDNMRRLVYAFYDIDFSFKDLFMKYPNSQPDLTDCLIGKLNRDFQELFQHLNEFSKPPEKVSIGLPLGYAEK